MLTQMLASSFSALLLGELKIAFRELFGSLAFQWFDNFLHKPSKKSRQFMSIESFLPSFSVR